MADRFDPRLIPPSISDPRARAFAEVARRALAEPDFRMLLIERIDDVPTAFLPFLIREFGLHKFVEPGMDEASIRRMLKASFELHKDIGYIRGVRFGLSLLGLRITRWVQWFQTQPKGAPGTHAVRIGFDAAVFPEGTAITARLRRAVHRMVRHTKRASQDIALGIETAADEVPVFVGMGFASRLRFRMASGPREKMHGQASIYCGAVFVSRLRYKMGI